MSQTQAVSSVSLKQRLLLAICAVTGSCTSGVTLKVSSPQQQHILKQTVIAEHQHRNTLQLFTALHLALNVSLAEHSSSFMLITRTVGPMREECGACACVYLHFCNTVHCTEDNRDVRQKLREEPGVEWAILSSRRFEIPCKSPYTVRREYLPQAVCSVRKVQGMS